MHFLQSFYVVQELGTKAWEIKYRVALIWVKMYLLTFIKIRVLCDVCVMFFLLKKMCKFLYISASSYRGVVLWTDGIVVISICFLVV